MELLAGERREGESDKAVIAFNDYARMGAGRSLEKLCDRYQTATESLPTKRLATLKQWSIDFDWVERASAYDAIVDASKTAEIQRLRTEGLAADYARIQELDAIYQALKTEFKNGDGIWFTDIKMSAKGDTVDVPVFNKPLIDSMRGVLDDIAKEVGGRKIVQEHSGPGGGPIRHKEVKDLSDAELEAILAAERGGGTVPEAEGT